MLAKTAPHNIGIAREAIKVSLSVDSKHADLPGRVVCGDDGTSLLYFLEGDLDLGYLLKNVFPAISAIEAIQDFKTFLGLGMTLEPPESWQYVRVDIYAYTGKASTIDVCNASIEKYLAKKNQSEHSLLHISALLDGCSVLAISSFNPNSWTLPDHSYLPKEDLRLMVSRQCP